MTKKLTIGSVLIVFLLSSCGIVPFQKNVLNGTSWTLISISGNYLIPGTSMTANFDSEEVNGSASCNHYFGSYSTKDGLIDIEGIGWTEMACLDPDGIMEQEQLIMSLFSQGEFYSIQGQIMKIITETGEEMLFQGVEVK